MAAKDPRGPQRTSDSGPRTPSCAYCSRRPVVGYEVLDVNRQDDGDGTAVCAGCSAFVKGSPSYLRKMDLTEYVSRSPDQVVGTTDQGLDDALHGSLAFEGNGSGPPTAAELLPKRVAAAACGWSPAAIIPGATILAASGVMTLAAQPPFWVDLCEKTTTGNGNSICYRSYYTADFWWFQRCIRYSKICRIQIRSQNRPKPSRNPKKLRNIEISKLIFF